VLTYKHNSSNSTVLFFTLGGGGGGVLSTRDWGGGGGYSQHATGGGGGTLNTQLGGGGGGQPTKQQNERPSLLAQALGLVLRCFTPNSHFQRCSAPMRTPYGSDFPALPLGGPYRLAPTGFWPVWLHRSVQPPSHQLVSTKPTYTASAVLGSTPNRGLGFLSTIFLF
jgi:hypothetical protein